MHTIFLLADDDVDDIELFCEALQTVDPSVECVCVQNGREALEMINSLLPNNQPQLIFLDINMPVMNGWDCLRHLKNNPSLKDIPVLIYSTTSREKDINYALDLGALCFFTKPKDYQELKAMLATIAKNVHGDLLNAIIHFNNIKSKKIFSCQGPES